MYRTKFVARRPRRPIRVRLSVCFNLLIILFLGVGVLTVDLLS
jgi:hypothetical protein